MPSAWPPGFALVAVATKKRPEGRFFVGSSKLFWLFARVHQAMFTIEMGVSAGDGRSPGIICG